MVSKKENTIRSPFCAIWKERNEVLSEIKQTSTGLPLLEPFTSFPVGSKRGERGRDRYALDIH